jgi:hypothetical protein
VYWEDGAVGLAGFFTNSAKSGIGSRPSVSELQSRLVHQECAAAVIHVSLGHAHEARSRVKLVRGVHHGLCAKDHSFVATTSSQSQRGIDESAPDARVSRALCDCEQL